MSIKWGLSILDFRSHAIDDRHLRHVPGDAAVMDQMAAAMLMLVLLGAVAGFVVGWIAHRDSDGRYLASRERHWERELQLALAQRAPELAETIRIPAATPPPAVVHVHLPVFPQGAPNWSPPVIEPIDLDALRALDRGGA